MINKPLGESEMMKIQLGKALDLIIIHFHVFNDFQKLIPRTCPKDGSATVANGFQSRKWSDIHQDG